MRVFERTVPHVKTLLKVAEPKFTVAFNKKKKKICIVHGNVIRKNTEVVWFSLEADVVIVRRDVESAKKTVSES